jgi:crotonobetainyl-CoA:carnitine CoA-transferase CaiB-like acyl-CoA transferase
VVEDYSQAFYSDLQARENGLVAELEHPTMGRLSLATNLVKFSGRAGGVRRPTPLLGEHTREVLADLGYAASDVQGLYDKGVAKTESPL